MNDYNYKISVVMPLYNVAEYLDEAIDSVVNQTIGFEENIQLILVNDGSTDNVDVICHKYEEKYPNNVKYIEQPNSGVSAARNNGIDYVEGKYVNFFDGDDKWGTDAYERMYDFIESNEEIIDFVAARICYFERRNGFKHPLDYKFEKTRIVDIIEEYDCVQLSAPTTLIKSAVVKAQKYDTRIEFSEDTIYMTKIVLNKLVYGVLREAVYYYRKRDSGGSAIDKTYTSREWYFGTPKYSYNKIIDESINRRGNVLDYVQYLIMYDIQWRLGKPMPDFFSNEDRKEYKSIIIALLMKIEDRIISEQKSINLALKVFALSLKYQNDIGEQIYLREQKAYFNDTYLFNIRDKNRVVISNLKIRKDVLYIEGYMQLNILPSDYSFVICDDKCNEFPIEYYRISSRDIMGFTGEVVLEGRGFRTEVPLGTINRIDYILKKGNGEFVRLSPSYGMLAKLDREQKNTYYTHGKWILKHRRYGLSIIENSIKRHIVAELRYAYLELLPGNKYSIIIKRIFFLLIKFIIRKQLWILFDMMASKEDNATELYSYITDNVSKGRKYYFAVDESSTDYAWCKRIGKILKTSSFKYKLCIINAEKIISIHTEDWIIDAFDENGHYMKNLYDFDYVFLQHEITNDDLASLERRI